MRFLRLPPRTGKSALAAVSVALAAAVLAPAAGATVLTSGFVEETLSTGGSGPTAMTKVPDGRTFLTEKSGRVRVVSPAGALVSTPLLDLRARVNSYSDRGLLGIAADLDFASNGFLYLLYSYELNPLMPDGSGPMVSRLTRVKVNPDNTVQNPSAPETPILGTDVSGPCLQPDNNRDCIPSDHYWHSIGTVRVDPVDGTLWVGNGDAHPHAVDANSYRPDDENTMAGKIMHVDRNGKGLAGHPFCAADNNLDHVCTKLYAKGFRNPFRFTLRPGKGPVVGDVGASAEEEIDLIKPGRNYGWPCYEGKVKTPLYDQEARCQQEYAKEGTPGAATPPNWSYSHGDGASVIAGPAYSGSGYPASFTGDIFVGDYVQGWVKRLDLDAEERVTTVHDFASGWPTGVDLQALPGTGDVGYVDLGYGAAAPGTRRFRYVGAANSAPAAVASGTPTSGPAPLIVGFTGSGSSDPDGDSLSYAWDFGDGATSSMADPSHSYSGSGTYTARLTVDDGFGHTATDPVTVTVGSAAPDASIDAPVDESTFIAGEAVALRGSAADAEDGPLDGAALEWSVLLHHASHIHELSTGTGRDASFTPLTDHDADSYYEVRLTATDSDGLTGADTIEIRPRTAQLTLSSSPPGARIDYADDAPALAPFTRTAAVGFRPTVAAQESFVAGGVLQRFSHWSDGGARQHAVSVPVSDSTLTAHHVPEDADQFVFTPEADTWVDSSTPTTNNGTSSRIRVDTTPAGRAFLRFKVEGLGGRAVRSVRLRMRQRDASKVGGQVFSISSNSWGEKTTTWSNQPAIDGPQRGSFGQVATGLTYETPLDTATVAGDGAVSLALDTTSSDASVWGSREFTEAPPQLIVDVAKATGEVDGLTRVADSATGSKESTAFGGNHHVATTAAGRLLAVHGRYASGVQLAWRNPGGGWQRSTGGAVGDGRLLSGASGDFPASIAVAEDAGGEQHAWVVWGSTSASAVRPIQMVRLDDLDAPGGPTVGPTVTVDAPALGAYRPDIAFERAPGGGLRGALVWSRRSTSTEYQVVTAWFSDLSSPTPAIHDLSIRESTTSSSSRWGGLVAASDGMRVVGRGSGSVMRVWRHAAGAPLTTWSGSGAGTAALSSGSPAAVVLNSGDLLGAVDSAINVVSVQRFSAAGTPSPVELSLSGYRQPTLTTDGTDAWLVAVRVFDGFVISRRFTPGSGWSKSDRVEIGAEGGGGYSWPNAVRTADGRLRILVRGLGTSTSRSAVLYLGRAL